MAKKKLGDYGTGIPLHEVEALARVLLPEMQKFFESEERQKEFREWKNSISKSNSKRRGIRSGCPASVAHRILAIEMINPNPSPTWTTAFGLS